MRSSLIKFLTGSLGGIPVWGWIVWVTISILVFALLPALLALGGIGLSILVAVGLKMKKPRVRKRSAVARNAPIGKKGSNIWWFIAIGAILFGLPIVACVGLFFAKGMAWGWLVAGFGWLLVFRFVFLAGFVTIAKVHFGVVTRFGKRRRVVLLEGIHWIIPYIDRVSSPLIEQKLENMDLNGGREQEVSVLSNDNLLVEVAGSLQYRANWRIGDEQGRNRFVEMSQEIIQHGISDAIEAELGEMAGAMKATDFVENRTALGLLLRCKLRLSSKSVPHHNGKKYGEPEDLVPAGEKRIELYKKNAKKIQEELEARSEISEIENRYGIDVVTANITRIGFQDSTQEALETQKRFELKQETVSRLISQGVPAKEAWLIVDGKLDGKSFSITGIDDALNALLNRRTS